MHAARSRRFSGAQIKVGSSVDIWLLSGSPALKGKVESVARGITDYDNRDGPELLANVNPTFTWVRLAQRIPVRIRLTDVPADVLISSGMTCTVTLEEGAEPHIGASARRVMAETVQLIEGVTSEIVNQGRRLVRAAMTRTEGFKA
jgi:multidrug resistance efflux pump